MAETTAIKPAEGDKDMDKNDTTIYNDNSPKLVVKSQPTARRDGENLPKPKPETEKEEASARFHRHTDACRSCCEPFDLCPEGSRLLRASVDAGNM